MSYRRKGRLLIQKNTMFPVPLDSNSERWYMDHIACHSRDKEGKRTMAMFWMLDNETSDKIREIQQEANDKILKICKENCHKAEPLNAEYHQKIIDES